jgi:conjugative transfer signal peptidase TraF
MSDHRRINAHALGVRRTLSESLLGRALLGWLLVLGIVACAAALGLRLNVSDSVPRGFYWASHSVPKRGDYAMVCPPSWPVFRAARAHGYFTGGTCPGDFEPLIKVVAATHGEKVAVGPLGVTINDRLWPHSAPRRYDASGWALPTFSSPPKTLAPHEVLVMSEHCELGFDARYFGPIPRTSIKATAVPLLTW